MPDPDSPSGGNNSSSGRRPEERISPSPKTPPGDVGDRKDLPPAARRALQEAAERCTARDAEAAKTAAGREIRGAAGLDPVRYGDWEIKGKATDF
jgi:hypothetical protein